MRVGILTGGGDCPGLNAVIRAVVRRGIPEYGYEFVGFLDGWRGPLEGLSRPLDVSSVRGLLPRGGTILGSSRTNPFAIEDGVARIRTNLTELGVDALVVIGGEDTLGVANRLHELGVNVVGVPKTIDNDLSGTDYTFGFDTAVTIATEAIDRLHTTAESHHRTLIVEVMGRHAGWIALHAGMAGGANAILIPEVRFDIDAGVRLGREPVPAGVRPDHRRLRGGDAPDGDESAARPGSRTPSATCGSAASATGWAARSRRAPARRPARPCSGTCSAGGRPPRVDRWLATRFGLHAVDAVAAGRWGQMVALRGTDIVLVPLEEATRELKLVDPALYAEAAVFFG